MARKYIQQWGIRFDNRVPRGSISWLVDRFHVLTPDAEIEADLRARIIKRNPNVDAILMRDCLRYAVECHHRNTKLFLSLR